MSEFTVVAHRVVSDALAPKLGIIYLHRVHEFAKTRKIMTNCKAAWTRYIHYLEEAKNKLITDAGKYHETWMKFLWARPRNEA